MIFILVIQTERETLEYGTVSYETIHEVYRSTHLCSFNKNKFHNDWVPSDKHTHTLKSSKALDRKYQRCMWKDMRETHSSCKGRGHNDNYCSVRVQASEQNNMPVWCLFVCRIRHKILILREGMIMILYAETHPDVPETDILIFLNEKEQRR